MNTTPARQTFAGDKKHLIHFLVPFERKLIAALLPVVPLQMGTAHLTLMTLIWSALIVVSGALAVRDIRWLWLFSACIFLQYVTDMLDGAVGRARNTGLIKWGFYMDHFLDYVFLSSIVIGYSFLLPSSYFFMTLVCLAVTAGFMVHVLMDFAITNNFKISVNYFGVSEMRMSLIFFNVALIILGKSLIAVVFPFFTAAAFIALCAMVYKSQAIYSHLDTIHQASQEMPPANVNQGEKV